MVLNYPSKLVTIQLYRPLVFHLFFCTMASTQVVSLNTVGQMKRVHFTAEDVARPVEEAAIPHFVSPKKFIKPSSNQRKRSSSFSLDNKQHHKRRRKEEFVRPTKFLLVSGFRFLVLSSI